MTAGGVDTAYARLGHGPPVLLLTGADRTQAATAALESALASRFRVVVPDMRAHDAAALAADAAPAVAFSAWLCDFLEALGIVRASIVADAHTGLPALGFALSEPTRVDRVVLLFRDVPGRRPDVGAPADFLKESGHPLLVLDVGGADTAESVGAVAARVLGFLSDGQASEESRSGGAQPDGPAGTPEGR